MIAIPLMLATALQGGPADRPVLLEVTASPAAAYVHEPVRITFRITLARVERAELVQMFQRPLDVPVQVLAPWLGGLEGAVPLTDPATEPAELTRSVALNDTVVRTSTRSEAGDGGSELTILEFHRDVLPDRPGELRIPSAKLRYATATSFREDLLGRVPLDRTDAEVESTSFGIDVLPLPDEGRPAEFTGAVGRLSIRADAEPRTLTLGESLRLTLTVTGRGNLHLFDAPRLEHLEDFRVYAHLEDKAPGRRTITYDIAPRSLDVSKVPSVPFAFFSPEAPAGYRSVVTESVPIEVLPPRPSGSPAARETGDSQGSRVQDKRSPRFGSILAAASILAIALIVLLARNRTRAER